jgi:hypothetical protein
MVLSTARGRVISATPQQWLAMVLALFVFLAAFALVVQPYADEFLYEHLLASKFEKRFGFRGARVKLRTTNGEYSVYTLVHVTAGGPLDRAGFHAGDVPSGWFHSQSAGFMQSLAMSCESPDREIFIGPWNPDGSRGEQRRLRLPCVP